MPLPWFQIARFLVTAGPVLKELAQGVNQLKKEQKGAPQADTAQRLAALETQVVQLTKIHEAMLARLEEFTQVLGAIQRSFRVVAVAAAGALGISIAALLAALLR